MFEVAEPAFLVTNNVRPIVSRITTTSLCLSINIVIPIVEILDDAFWGNCMTNELLALSTNPTYSKRKKINLVNVFMLFAVLSTVVN